MRKKISEWWDGMTWTSTWIGAKQVGQHSWSTAKGLPWRYILSFAWFAPALEKLVSIVLKLGTLLLVVLFLVFFIRLFKDQGYVIQQFSVPKQLEEQGYNGEVMAIRLQDKLLALKELANTVKTDSLQLNSDEEDIDLSVLGVGLSLRTLAFQIRDALGRENKTLRGEITRIGDRYEAQIRMTGYPTMRSVQISKPGQEAETLNLLFKELAENILFHTDPYRLVLVLRKEERYEEAIDAIRHLLRTNEAEAHWAYLGWGSMLNELGDVEGAVEKYEKAIELEPDFSLPYVNVAYLYLRQGRTALGIDTYRKGAALEPDNFERQNSLGWILFNNDRPESADSLYEAVLGRNDIDAEYRNGMALGWAEMRFQRDDIAGAKEILDTHVKMEGENVFSYLIKGVVAFSQQDTLGALDFFKAAYEIDPSSEIAINSNISFARLVGDHDHVVHVHRTADWSQVNDSQKMNALNQLAMEYNTRTQHDSAMVLIKEVIQIDTTISYPYTTLAETHHFQGQTDSFYYYTEKALEMGFDQKYFGETDPPYDYFKDQLRYQQLLRKYRKEDTEDLKN